MLELDSLILCKLVFAVLLMEDRDDSIQLEIEMTNWLDSIFFEFSRKVM